jgi:2,4-dienoyl-CoA reductase-like NADH-dependent reductase (Old Yellow Enzyme family)
MSRLFAPWSLGRLELRNRIVIAPMCQYSAEQGCATDWHMLHLGHMVLSGASLLILEATAVAPEGRITASDLGLYSQANEVALDRVLKVLRAHSPMRLAIQLSHAGRKASSRPPWEGGRQLRAGEPGGWQTLGPSALPHGDGEGHPARSWLPGPLCAAHQVRGWHSYAGRRPHHRAGGGRSHPAGRSS